MTSIRCRKASKLGVLKYYKHCNIITVKRRETKVRGTWLRAARRRRGWTQQEAASRLGVSQGYLSLLEHEQRRVPRRLVPTLQKHFDVPADELPVEEGPTLNAQRLAERLAALGYPGFSYLRSQKKLNPAQVVFAALRQPNLETRLTEALPWVLLRYSTRLHWNWLLGRVKVHDLQNRLGFVVTLARALAERQKDHARAFQLADVERRLERSRLAREDTLCHDSMTEAERRWLREQRPPEARHWNLLTDLVSDHLPHAA